MSVLTAPEVVYYSTIYIRRHNADNGDLAKVLRNARSGANEGLLGSEIGSPGGKTRFTEGGEEQ